MAAGKPSVPESVGDANIIRIKDYSLCLYGIMIQFEIVLF